MTSFWDGQSDALLDALIRLPIAAILSAILAFRPRRRGTPKRQAPVIQTQIVLALVGAMVMLVVGASLARAFGIVERSMSISGPRSWSSAASLVFCIPPLCQPGRIWTRGAAPAQPGSAPADAADDVGARVGP